ncbi:hypothetical protein ILYODFUR_037794 [Ilyodon furcidens]|uniref:Uncharacterized protein n=1 Tax=Ilyodon furcidens TaxID=33524 RepID=A0ABV0TQI9_9TELE
MDSPKKYESGQPMRCYTVTNKAQTQLHPSESMFFFRVIKNLTMFFHENSLQYPELVVVELIRHMFHHSSSVNVIFASLSHVFLIYNVDVFFCRLLNTHILESVFLLDLPL